MTGSGATTGTLLGSITAANQGSFLLVVVLLFKYLKYLCICRQSVSVTLGNTASQISNSNTPFIIGANGSVTGGNGQDLYTEDNADTVDGETAGIQ